MLPFLDRAEERARLARLLARAASSLGVLYGRRRCGKSRLLREVLPPDRAVYYVADDRHAALQRASLAREIGRLVPAFERAGYPDWDALIDRFWREAPPGSVLVVDELPALVAQARELPSVLQKRVDRSRAGRPHLILAGSSQRMMQGLVLDRSAPLFGRAVEILRIGPLLPGWIREALGVRDAAAAVEAWAVWGGVPRYWELASDHASLEAALDALVLSPLGVLYDEPSALLLDDMREATRAATVLSLVGQGCRRLSEVAGRLGRPATSLSRPLKQLVDLGYLRRDQPFGASPREGKRSAYRIEDPFLRTWFRFVEPSRSRLEAGLREAVRREVRERLPAHIGEAWEDLARASVPRLRLSGRAWGPAARWWGPGLDRRPLEVDVVAEAVDGGALLVGEAKWGERHDRERLAAELRDKVARLPFASGREVSLALWLRAPRKGRGARVGGVEVIDPDAVLSALR